MRWIRRLTLTLALSLTLAALGFTQASPGEQSGSSAQLYVFSGSVTVAGEQAPEGFVIVAKVGDYTSEPVTVRSGQYHQLKVLPGIANYNGQLISFWSGNVQADEFGGRYVQRGVFGVPALVDPGPHLQRRPGELQPLPDRHAHHHRRAAAAHGRCRGQRSSRRRQPPGRGRRLVRRRSGWWCWSWWAWAPSVLG